MTEGNRHRERIVDDTITVEDLVTYKATGSNPLSLHAWYNSTSCRLISESMDDVVTPDFTRIQKSGGIINNPMTKIRSEIIDVPLEVDIRMSLLYPPPQIYERYRCVGKRAISSFSAGQALPIPADCKSLDTLADIAISQAWANVGSNEMLALASVGELNATVDGLRFLLEKVAKIAKAVRKKQLKHLKRELTWKELQEVYMNARYNLRPLAYDIKGLMKVLERSAIPERQTFRGYQSDSAETMEESTDLIFYKYSQRYESFVRKVSRVERSVRAGVLTSVGNQGILNSLGLDKTVETLWDLTPYSFILDWFCNISDVISSWVPVVGFRTLASWVVKEETTTQLVQYGDLLYQTSSDYGAGICVDTGTTCKPGSYTKIVKKVERIPNYSRPILPSINLKLDPLKILDLAIIAKNIRKNAAYVKNG